MRKGKDPVEKVMRLLKDFSLHHSLEILDDAKQRIQNAFFESLLDAQIAKLREAGVPDSIMETLASSREQVIKAARARYSRADHIAFLPVIPFSYLSLHSQLIMGKCRQNLDMERLKPSHVTNQEDTLHTPYWIVNVGFCQGTFDPKQKKVTPIEYLSGWLFLNLAETVALYLHSSKCRAHSPIEIRGSRGETGDTLMMDIYGVGFEEVTLDETRHFTVKPAKKVNIPYCDGRIFIK